MPWPPANAVLFKPSEHAPGVGAWLADASAQVVPEAPVPQLVTGFAEGLAGLLTGWLAGLLAVCEASGTRAEEGDGWLAALRQTLEHHLKRGDVVSHFAVAADVIRTRALRPGAFQAWGGRAVVLRAETTRPTTARTGHATRSCSGGRSKSSAWGMPTTWPACSTAAVREMAQTGAALHPAAGPAGTFASVDTALGHGKVVALQEGRTTCAAGDRKTCSRPAKSARGASSEGKVPSRSLVRTRDEVRPMYERILLAVDASEHCRKAVAAAAEIASRFQSEVLIVHVREPLLAETGDHLETEREANELAEWAAEELRSPGVHARVSVCRSGLRGVAGAILAVAGDFHPGLIVMGSRGLSVLEGLLLGSVSHKVIQLADSPVLVVR